MNCPNCHLAMETISLPFTPRYLCRRCHRGFCAVEAASSGWRPEYRDFGGLSVPERIALRLAVEAEMG